jgi:dolichol-phosphate mannosyltransferase
MVPSVASKGIMMNGRGDAGQRVLIFTATYNEVDNIRPLCEQLLRVVGDADLLVVDDDSPDGTGRVLDELASEHARIKAVHRPGKLGLGTAHKLAMKHALLENYDFLVTMDADFSHKPEDIPRLLKIAQDADFVIGSRYAKGGRSDLVGYRGAVSRLANIAARLLLGIPLTEFTTSFRVFRVDALRNFSLGRIRAQGYSFFLETVFRVARSGARIAETPIHFVERAEGESKIPRLEIANGMSKLLYLFCVRLIGSKPPAYSESADDSRCSACQQAYLIEQSPRRAILGFGWVMATRESAASPKFCLYCGNIECAGPR